MDYFSSKWGTKKFVMIGYSLGAEIVPFIVNRFPDELKTESSLLFCCLLLRQLISRYILQICLESAIAIIHTKLSGRLPECRTFITLIIFRRGEKTEVPDLLTGTPVIIRKIPGDHHYNFNVHRYYRNDE